MKKNKKLGNKGYLLIEIILASVIAFGLAYFILELTLKLKNKNDDLLVETLISTDNAIISNAVMKYMREHDGEFTCNNISISGNKVYIGPVDNREFVIEVNEYATIGNCSNNGSNITINHITIPLKITQSNKHFDVDIYYRLS